MKDRNLIAATINEAEVLRGDLVPIGFDSYKIFYYSEKIQCELGWSELVELLEFVKEKKEVVSKRFPSDSGDCFRDEISMIDKLIVMLNECEEGDFNGRP